jgi:hypothetical protein
MTDDIVQTRQAIAAKDRSGKLTVTGKLRTAILEMVWKGSRRAVAANAAGMTDHGLRSALKKPHVLAFMHEELRVLREAERPRNLHAMIQVRDGKGHSNAMARLNAAKALEGIEETGPNRPGHNPQAPGLWVVINAFNGKRPPADAGPIVDVTPEQHEDIPALPPFKSDKTW